MRRVLLICAFLGGCGVVTGTNVWIGNCANRYIYTDLESVPPRHTAIVPGARVYRDGTPTAVLEDRLFAALSLYRAGKVDKILVSGDHLAQEYDEVNVMWYWLSERNVPPEDIFLDHAGLRTFDTMVRANRVFTVESAIVCTQAFHLPRSVFLARREGIDAVGLVADRRAYLYAKRDKGRELIAKTVAFLDSYLLGTEPRYGGGPFPINGNGQITHDRFTGKKR